MTLAFLAFRSPVIKLDILRPEVRLEFYLITTCLMNNPAQFKGLYPQKNMRIVLLAQNLASGGGLSMGKGLLAALPEVAPMHQYLMIVPENCGYPGPADHENIDVLPVSSMPLWRRLVWEQLHLPKLITAFRPDWLWCLGNYGCPRVACRQSVLVQMSHLLNYTWKHFGYPPRKTIPKFIRIAAQKHLLRSSLRSIERVYCQTPVIRTRFLQTYRYPEQRVGLCPGAPAPKFSPWENSQPPAAMNPYQDRFCILYLSGYRPHKNFERIVSMYSKYRQQLSDTVTFFTLSPSPEERKLMNRVKSLSLDSLIINLGEIPNEDIGAYLKHSDVMFMPTLLETFGIPFIEAFHFGCPVLTSDLDFARMVCGDAAAYVDPFSIESMRDGILSLKDNPQLRHQLIQQGKERCQKHVRSWNDIAVDVLDQEGIEHA